MPAFRRSLLAAGVAAAAMAATAAFGQAFPNKPLRLVIPFPAGSATDISFRPVAEHMSGTLGQNVIMDFRPGAGAVVAGQFVKSQAPDGYTFMLGTPALVSGSLRPGSDVDIRRDFAAIAPTTVSPLVIVVNAEQVKATNLKELVEEARAKGGQMNYASYGVGSGAHVFMELLLHEAKVKMVHVPYQGTAQATTDAAVGRVQVSGTIMATARPHLAAYGGSGRLRLIGMSTAEAIPAIAAGVPGMREAGFPQIDFPLWGGFIGPNGLVKSAVEAIGRASTIAYKDPKIMEAATRFGQTPVYGGPEDLARIISREYEATARLIKDVGLKLE